MDFVFISIQAYELIETYPIVVMAYVIIAASLSFAACYWYEDSLRHPRYQVIYYEENTSFLTFYIATCMLVPSVFWSDAHCYLLLEHQAQYSYWHGCPCQGIDEIRP